MRHAIGLTVLFLSTLALAAAPVPKEKPKVKDEEAILGTWAVEKLDLGEDRNAPPEDEAKKMRFTFKKEGKLLMGGPDSRSKEGDYKLDSSAKVKTIDLISNGRTAPGIYELDGDTLKLAIAEGNNAERPTEMKPDATKRTGVVTLKRVKDAEAAPAVKPPLAKEAAVPVPEKK